MPESRCYQWNMPKHSFHKMNPQVIPCYPFLYTYITGYPGISLANDAAPGLLLDSPALPVQPGGPSDMSLEDAWHARPQLFFKCILRPQNGRPPKNPSWTRGPDDLEATLVFFSTFEELKLPATGPMDRHGHHQAVRAVSYSDPVRRPLQKYAWQGATLSLFPASQRYSHHTSQLAAPQGQRVSVRDSRRNRCGRT